MNKFFFFNCKIKTKKIADTPCKPRGVFWVTEHASSLPSLFRCEYYTNKTQAVVLEDWPRTSSLQHERTSPSVQLLDVWTLSRAGPTRGISERWILSAPWFLSYLLYVYLCYQADGKMKMVPAEGQSNMYVHQQYSAFSSAVLTANTAVTFTGNDFSCN